MAEFARAPGLETIQAPKLVAVALNAFVRKVITNAKTLKPFPSRMTTRVTQLEASLEELSAALGIKHGEDLSADPKRVEADRNVDDAVRAYFEFLSAMSRMSAPIGPVAAGARSSFFPKDDLAFLNLEFEQEWSVIDTRVSHADSEGVFAQVEEIGGGLVISNLKKKHKEYGKALGVTAATTRTIATTLEGPYARAQDALRRFIAAAIAHGAESDIDPSVIAEAETLLAPIEEARARIAGRRAKGSKGGEEGTEPVDGTTEDPKPAPSPDGSD